MSVSLQKQRNLGIDCLRAFAMILVVMFHFIGQGGLLSHAEPGSANYWMLSFIQVVSVCCVNLYGITTGYLMCDKGFRLFRVVKLWATTVFWSVAVSCVLFAVSPETKTVKEMISMFLPVLRGRYWFFTAYFVVMMLSPVLNLVIRSLTAEQYHLLLAVFFLIFGIIPVGALGNDVLRISTGHHFSWMVVLYLLGGYLKRNDHRWTKKPQVYLIGSGVFAGVHLLYKAAVNFVGLQNYADLLLTYPSPLVVGETVCLFLFFRTAFSEVDRNSLFGKAICFAAPGVYSVYVIHVHPLVFWNADIIKLFRAWDPWNALQLCGAMVGTALLVFLICICLDAIRQRLFRLLKIDLMLDKVSSGIEMKMRKLLR